MDKPSLLDSSTCKETHTMNRAQSIIQQLEETVEKTALVHPDHAEALHKRLKEKHVKHHKNTKPT